MNEQERLDFYRRLEAMESKVNELSNESSNNTVNVHALSEKVCSLEDQIVELRGRIDGVKQGAGGSSPGMTSGLSYDDIIESTKEDAERLEFAKGKYYIIQQIYAEIARTKKFLQSLKSKNEQKTLSSSKSGEDK